MSEKTKAFMDRAKEQTIGCGLHLHIGAQGQTPQSLRNLANLMAAHENLLSEALNIDSYRQHRFCRTVNPEFLKLLNEKKPTTMSRASMA